MVAVRRGSTLWLGVTDATFNPIGPLAAAPRQATLGRPDVAGWAEGGVVAWAERPQGEREWQVMVAGFTAEGLAPVGPLRALGPGTTPSLTALADGDVLVTYVAQGRVLVRRLSRELEPRGEPVVVSPPGETAAAEPVVAVAANGRGVVAYFEGARAAVVAAPIACDPGP